MTDEELRQLIESNARSIQGLSQSIADLANQGRQTDARINQLSQRITELTDQGRRTDARLYQLADILQNALTGMAQSQTTTLQGMDDFEQRLLTIEQKVQDLENQAQ